MTTAGPRSLFNPLYWGSATFCCVISLWSGSVLVALLTIIAFGLPHGALDGEMAREMLGPRFGRVWFPVFALPYLMVILLMLVAWRLYPLSTLSFFLALSLWHFGNETQMESKSLPAILVLGGAPLILPSIFRPEETAALLGAMAPPAHMTAPPSWLIWLFPFWCATASAWLGACRATERLQKLLQLVGFLALFSVLPPLDAFMCYFVFQHAPAHVAALIDDPRWPRLVSEGSALRHALPLTIATLILGAALFPLHTGTVSERLLTITFQLLAALTLPHMIFDVFIGRQKMPLRA